MQIKGSKIIATNIYWIQANESIICGYFFIGHVDFILKHKSLLDHISLFSHKEYEKDDNT